MRATWGALFWWAPAAFASPLPNLPTTPITGTIVAANDNSSTNIPTSDYVQLIASTANDTSGLCISNSSARIIKVATGAAASEVDRLYLPSGAAGCYPVFVAHSTRISLKALDGTASTGFFTFTGF